MNFKIRVANASNPEGWLEAFTKTEVVDQQSAERWAADTIAWFNRTLHRGEEPRWLIEVQFGEGWSHCPAGQ